MEGLVTFIINPPIGLEPIHVKGTSRHLCDISDLLNYRVDGNDQNDVHYDDEDDGDSEPLVHVGLHPDERVILSELQTEGACWFLGILWEQRRWAQAKDIEEFYRRKSLASASPTMAPSARVHDGNTSRHFALRENPCQVGAPYAGVLCA
ncbi:hypothetical protein P691DRAFT_852062 [Macrolepiota fuliginosa MF-IS2]|uniref:Uncharacterized protein n=1 Tax=Macrolepiota fuliginosa MF-IS2 TaxID=1400762 RepID=A0A9P5XEN6_9AGAR|nr:hypothetical protein P691DRAFT_852062 [Macrolepiota fuliginosa MF-IS2]